MVPSLKAAQSMPSHSRSAHSRSSMPLGASPRLFFHLAVGQASGARRPWAAFPEEVSRCDHDQHHHDAECDVKASHDVTSVAWMSLHSALDMGRAATAGTARTKPEREQCAQNASPGVTGSVRDAFAAYRRLLSGTTSREEFLCVIGLRISDRWSTPGTSPVCVFTAHLRLPARAGQAVRTIYGGGAPCIRLRKQMLGHLERRLTISAPGAQPQPWFKHQPAWLIARKRYFDASTADSTTASLQRQAAQAT